MTRLSLPDDNWALLASPKKVQERKRRRYIAELANLSAKTSELPRNPNKPDEPDPRHMAGAHLEAADRVGDALILCLVKEWSFGDVTQEVLEGLEADCFDPILRACRDLAGGLLPDYSPDIDPKAPTSASTGPPPGS